MVKFKKEQKVVDQNHKNFESNVDEHEKDKHHQVNLGKDNLKPGEVREARGHFYGRKWTPDPK